MRVIQSLRKVVVLAAVAAAGFAAHAADPSWVHLTATNDGEFTWEAKAGSQRLIKNKAGHHVIAITLRAHNSRLDRFEFEQWYLRLDHCRAGAGVVTVTNLSGVLKGHAEWVSRGGTASSHIADLMCLIAADMQGQAL